MMKNYLKLASVIFIMSFAKLSQAQTYCEYSIGFAWCGTSWSIDDITIGTFSQLNGGCNSGPYNNGTSTTITVSKGANTPFTLGSGGTSVQWAIWVDLNKDGDFTDATDFFWASSSPSATVSGNMLIPSSTVPANTRIRIASRSQSLAILKTDACNFGYQAETQDFNLLMNAAGGCNVPTTLNAFPTSTSALLSWDSVGTLYNVEHGLTGFTQGAGTTIHPTTDTTTITGLTPNTFYDFYVQNDCSAATSADSSSWNGPFTFATLCTPVSTFPYSEGFEDADWAANSGYYYTNDTISQCWDRFPLYSWNYAWLVRTGSTPSSNTGPSGAFAGNNYMYVETNGSAGDEAFFTSPQFNTSTLTSPWLTFKYHMYGSAMGNLYAEVSVNGGQTWTTIDSLVGQQQISDVSAWLERGLDVTTYKGTNFKFRFRAKHMGGYSYGDMAIDQITLGEAPACKKVSNFAITNITGSTADANWSSNESKFYVEIGVSGFTQGTGAIDTISTTSDSFNGLAGDTYWDVYVKTDCSANGNGASAWSGPYSFRTLIRPDWLEDFTDGYVPNIRWTEAKGVINNPTVLSGTYSNWGQDGWLNAPGIYTGAVRCNISKWGVTNDWFFTESIDLGTAGNNYEVHFDMAATIGSATGSIALENDDTVKVVISTDNGLTWNDSNTVMTISKATNLTNTGGTYTASLAGYSGIVKIGLYCESSIANTNSIDIFLDNLGVRLPAACPAPTALNASNITHSDVTVGWTGNATATSYDVEYGPVGFGQGTGTVIAGITADSVVVTGLNSVTQYDFYVTSNCPLGNSSAGPLTVLTGCPPIFTTPYFENFDILAAGNPPPGGAWDNCWTSDNSAGYVYRWQTSKGAYTWANTGPSADHTQGTGGEGVYMYTEASNNGLDATLMNGPFDLSGLTTPTLSFWYHMYGADMGDLNVDISTDNVTWNEGAFVLTGPQQAAGTDAWLEAKLALSQYVNDTIYIRFRGVKGSGSYGDMAIDDVSLENATGCIPPSGLTSTNRTSTTIDLNWGTYESPSTIEWGLENFKQTTGATSTFVYGITGASHSLTGLTANTAYDYYVKDTCNASTAWIGPHTFFTDCVGPLSGTYTIGGTPGATNFTTIKEAVQSLNNCGVSGPVTLNLMGVSHKGVALEFTEISGSSSTNTVTFNGTSADSISVTGNNTIIFNGAGNIILNGMYIRNSGGFNAIWMHNGAHDISIENCEIYGPTGTSSTRAAISAALLGNSANSEGQNSFNINISGNTINGGYSSINIYGDNDNPTHGLTVTDNVFKDAYYYGLRVYGVDSVVAKDNYMYDTQNTYGGYGINMAYTNEFEVSRNYMAGKSYGLYLVNVNNDTVSHNSTVVNNMFVGLNNGSGMYFTNSNSVDIFHNSAFGGNRGVYFSAWSTGLGNHFDVRNNIFVGNTSYALYNSMSGSDVSFNYNIYEANGTSFVYDGTTYSDLAAWKIGNTTENINSIQGDPGFATNEDLHIIGVLPNDVGDNTVGINTDIDGDTRPLSPSTTVDIGADEFTPKGNDASVVRIITPGTSCGDSLAEVKLLIRNLGSITITSVPLTVNVTGDVTATLNYTYTGSLLSLDYDTVVVGNFNSFGGGQNVNVQAYPSLANDEDAANDTVVKGPMFFIAGEPTYHAPDTVCNDPLNDATLAAIAYPGVDYAWYANVNDTVATAVGDSFTFSLSGQKDWYLGYQGGKLDSLNTLNFMSLWGGTGGVMFDVTAKTNIELTGFDLNSRVNIGDTGTFTIHFIPNGTYDGNELDANAWTAHETVKYVGTGTGNVSKVTLVNPLPISVNSTYAIYLEYNCAWETGNSVTQTQNTPLLKFEGGSGLYGSFSSLSNNRIFDGVIRAQSVVCSDSRVLVSVPLNMDTAVATIASATTTGAYTINVDATGSSGHLYDWNFGDGNTGTGMITTHTYTNGGMYEVKLIVTDTVCGTSDTAIYTFNNISVDESLLNASLNVYPNPNNGAFRIAFDIEGVKDVEVVVLDAIGRVVYTNTSKVAGTHQSSIDLTNEAKGMYIVQITTDDHTVSRRITVQ